METKFNLGQVLQIAEKLEHNAAAFYLKIADRFGDQARRSLCSQLADWRTKREKAFAEQKDAFYKPDGKLEASDSEDYLLSHPSVMAALSVFAEKRSIAGALTGRESTDEILKDAIVRAIEAITFYRGLKDFAQDRAKDVLDTIIAEEDRYVRSLQQMLPHEPLHPLIASWLRDSSK